MSHREAEPNCLNCGAELQGTFCHACGQKAASVHVGMHDFVHDATHEFLHLDGKILQTVKLLVTKPGQLTKEFLEGRRVRYITPVRLYLTFSLVFFTLAAVLPGEPRTAAIQGDTKGLQGDTAFERKLIVQMQKAQKEGRKLSESVMHNLPRAAFVLMPIFGLLTWAFYRKQQRYYIPHLYYSVHFHSFVFLVMCIALTIGRLTLRPVGASLLVLTVPYHFISLRRVFGGSRGITFAKGMAIGLLYWLIVMVVVFGMTLLLILSL